MPGAGTSSDGRLPKQCQSIHSHSGPSPLEVRHKARLANKAVSKAIRKAKKVSIKEQRYVHEYSVLTLVEDPVRLNARYKQQKESMKFMLWFAGLVLWSGVQMLAPFVLPGVAVWYRSVLMAWVDYLFDLMIDGVMSVVVEVVQTTNFAFTSKAAVPVSISILSQLLVSRITSNTDVPATPMAIAGPGAALDSTDRTINNATVAPTAPARLNPGAKHAPADPAEVNWIFIKLFFCRVFYCVLTWYRTKLSLDMMKALG